MIYRLLFPESHYSCLPESRALLHIRLAALARGEDTSACFSARHAAVSVSTQSSSCRYLTCLLSPPCRGLLLGTSKTRSCWQLWFEAPVSRRAWCRAFTWQSSARAEAGAVMSVRMIFARLVFHLGFWLFLFFFNAKQQFLVTGRSFCTPPSPSVPLVGTVQGSPGEMMVGTWDHWESEEKDDFQHLGTNWQVKVILHLSNGQYLKGF